MAQTQKRTRRGKLYTYQLETQHILHILNALDSANPGRRTISQEAMRLGAGEHEPLLVMMDSLIRYAKAHRAEIREQAGRGLRTRSGVVRRAQRREGVAERGRGRSTRARRIDRQQGQRDTGSAVLEGVRHRRHGW